MLSPPGDGGGDGNDGAPLICRVVAPYKDLTLDNFLGVRILFDSIPTTFGYECFYECIAIAEAIAPYAEIVGDSAFGYCGYLKRVDMPLVTVVEDGGFVHCDVLTDVNLPSVETIGIEAFASCWGLKKVDFPMVKNIAALAFSKCYSLTAVILRTTETVCVCDLTSFEDTPLMTGEGHVYVPASMYEYYRAGYEPAFEQIGASGFFDILFRKIEDYPEICG